MEVHLEELDPGRDRRGADVDAHHGIPTHAQQSREEDGHLATASGGCPAGTTWGRF